MKTLLQIFSLILIFYVVFELFLAMSYVTAENIESFALSLKFHKNKILKRAYLLMKVLGGHRVVAGSMGALGLIFSFLKTN